MSWVRQFSLAGGELAPSLYGRVDVVRYSTAVATMRNWWVMKSGGAETRPGTIYVGEVADSSLVVRLVPWVFNSAQTYVLEFYNLGMRVIRDGGYVTDLTLTINAITKANPGVVTYTGTDPSNGDIVYIDGVYGMSQVNGRFVKVANVNGGANTFEMTDSSYGTNINSTAYTTYTSGGTAARVYKITTPYATADLSTLSFAQSADVMYIAQHNYAPRQLTRAGHTSWTLATITFAPSQAAPTALLNNGGAGAVTSWTATAVSSDFEESLEATATSSAAIPTSGAPITVTWTAAAGAVEYNVYKALNGVYGFIGVAVGTSFVDIGYVSDVSDTPPAARNPFGSAGNYPATVTLYQNRLIFAATDNDPETVWTSRVSFYPNFTVSSPTQDDDAVTFSLAGRQVNEVRHMIDQGKLIILTSGGEQAINGDDAGILRPNHTNNRTQSYNGASTVRPVVIDGTIIYVQDRGSVVRDLAFSLESDGYRGNDLTTFSSHLFRGYTITDTAFQGNPNSIAWFVRSDGQLMALTYIREHQIAGWSRHDTGGGTYENVCVVPEGDEDALYVVVKRTINGIVRRYVERLQTRFLSAAIIKDFIGMDCSRSYDGRNTGSTTMTPTGAGWTPDDTLTMTASAGYFVATDVGNAIVINGLDAAGDAISVEFVITVFTNTTTVSVKPDQTVPVGMRAVATTNWGKAVDEMAGLWPLEAKAVSVFADGDVIGSPNNPEVEQTFTVTNGAISFGTAIDPERYQVIHAGLPITADIGTLSVDSTQDGRIMTERKLATGMGLFVEKTRGLYIGQDEPDGEGDDGAIEGLYPPKIRDNEHYDESTDLLTGVIEISIEGMWSEGGRCFIRQVDPVPATLLSFNLRGVLLERG